MAKPLLPEANLLLGMIFYRVKQMLLAAVEDGDKSFMPSDNEIADTMVALIGQGHLDPVTLEDEALHLLL